MINQTLFSAIGKEIYNNEYLKQNADIKLYKSGKIAFSDLNEKFTVIINNSEQAAKVLAKYGIKNFAVGPFAVISDLAHYDPFQGVADKIGISHGSKERGAIKKKVGNELGKISANFKENKRILDKCEPLMEGINGHQKVKRLQYQLEKLGDRSEKYAEKIGGSSAVKAYEKEAEHLKKMHEAQLEELEELTSKVEEGKASTKDISRKELLEEVRDLDHKEYKELQENIKDLEEKLDDAKKAYDELKKDKDVSESKLKAAYDKIKEKEDELKKLKSTISSKKSTSKKTGKDSTFEDIKFEDENLSYVNKYSELFKANLENFSKKHK